MGKDQASYLRDGGELGPVKKGVPKKLIDRPGKKGKVCEARGGKENKQKRSPPQWGVCLSRRGRCAHSRQHILEKKNSVFPRGVAGADLPRILIPRQTKHVP